MTIAAGKHCLVPCMAERNFARVINAEKNIRRRSCMTLVTTPGYCEGGFAIMASAAGLALLHIRHGKSDTAAPPDEN